MKTLRTLLITFVGCSALGASMTIAEPELNNGERLYKAHCASCHGGTVAKAPPLTLLQIMTGSSVLRAMNNGVMQSQAAMMSAEQRVAVATWLTGMDPTQAAMAPAPACEGEVAAVNVGNGAATSGWGVDLENRRHFDSASTSLSAGDIQGLELKWAFAYPEALRARSQPAIAGNTLFVGSQNGTVYALDRRTGCERWSFSTIAEVRTGIVIDPRGDLDDGFPLIYFGDLVGNVYAVNAGTGALIWRDRPDDHPSLTLTAAPALHEGVLYVPLSSLEVTEAADPKYACCTFRGGVAAYEAATGKRLWTGYTIDEAPAVVGKNAVGTDRIAPSGAPVWNTPAIDTERGLLYVGTGENYSSPANDTSDAIVALRLSDGSIAWHQQMTAGDAWNMGCETPEKINCPPEDGPDYDFGAATIVATNSEGRDLIIAGQKSGHVHALDPDQGGKLVWQRKLGRGGIQGGVHFGMAVDGDTVYVPMSDFDGGPRWPGTPRPGMFALELHTGGTRWYAPSSDRCEGREYCQPGISAAASSLPGGVVAGAMDGVLRVYNRESGNVMHEFDSTTTFETLDGGSAHGGSFGGASGPVFNGDMMFINSGYGIYFHMPGNVLLAFGPKDP